MDGRRMPHPGRVKTVNADTILTKNERALFPDRDEKKISATFRAFAKAWHPDHNSDPKASSVFAHITEMHRRALKRGEAPHVVFTRESGSSFRMEYQRQTTGEGVEIYVGQSSIAYLVGEANSDLADRASAHKWKFASADMEKEMTRFLPGLVREERLQGGRLFVYRRTPDQILMRDLMDLTSDRIDPVHVSWMVTRMNNIACYLEYAEISHLSIAPEFLLVSLQHHGVSLTGPALYATKLDSRPKAAPRRTMTVVPDLTRPDFLCGSTIDRRLIRQTALELLGDPSGNRIRTDASVRPDIAQWLSMAPSKTAIEDYASWEASLGERKFVVYPKSAQELYAA
jgi:hypothetical protein